MAYRKYRVVVEGTLTVTNMTADEIKNSAFVVVDGWRLKDQKVTVTRENVRE